VIIDIVLFFLLLLLLMMVMVTVMLIFESINHLARLRVTKCFIG
jgi:hypothetical protein